MPTTSKTLIQLIDLIRAQHEPTRSQEFAKLDPWEIVFESQVIEHPEINAGHPLTVHTLVPLAAACVKHLSASELSIILNHKDFDLEPPNYNDQNLAIEYKYHKLTYACAVEAIKHQKLDVLKCLLSRKPISAKEGSKPHELEYFSRMGISGFPGGLRDGPLVYLMNKWDDIPLLFKKEVIEIAFATIESAKGALGTPTHLAAAFMNAGAKYNSMDMFNYFTNLGFEPTENQCIEIFNKHSVVEAAKVIKLIKKRNENENAETIISRHLKLFSTQSIYNKAKNLDSTDLKSLRLLLTNGESLSMNSHDPIRLESLKEIDQALSMIADPSNPPKEVIMGAPLSYACLGAGISIPLTVNPEHLKNDDFILFLSNLILKSRNKEPLLNIFYEAFTIMGMSYEEAHVKYGMENLMTDSNLAKYDAFVLSMEMNKEMKVREKRKL